MEDEEKLYPDWRQLPPEIWFVIVENNEPKDLQNLLLASPNLWDPILNQSKTTFLFSLILPVITDRFVDKRTVLKCRLVSKSWKRFIDKFIINHPCFYSVDGINHEVKRCCVPTHTDSSFCWQRTTVEIQFPYHIEKILEKLEAEPASSPFITRSLGFRDFILPTGPFEDEIAPNLWNLFITLLQKIGPSVHHFRFQSSRVRSGPLFYNYIHQLLQLLPNLRSLKLWFTSYPGDMRVPECEELTASKPPPDLDKLAVLRVVHVPTVITNALLKKYSGSLDKLEIVSPDRHHHLYKYDNHALNRVLHINEIFIRLWDLTQVWNLQSSGLLSGYLKSLNVFIDVNDPDSLEKFIYVLSTSNAADMIENLFMETNTQDRAPRGAKKRCLDPQTRLELPSLKRLKIVCATSLFNTMDFILGLDSLVELTVVVKNSRFCDQWERQRGYNPELLNFIGLEEILYESNIWELMPKLSTILFMYEDEVLDDECVKMDGVFFDRESSTYKQQFKYNRAAWEKKKNERNHQRQLMIFHP